MPLTADVGRRGRNEDGPGKVASQVEAFDVIFRQRRNKRRLGAFCCTEDPTNGMRRMRINLRGTFLTISLPSPISPRVEGRSSLLPR